MEQKLMNWHFVCNVRVNQKCHFIQNMSLESLTINSKIHRRNLQLITESYRWRGKSISKFYNIYFKYPLSKEPIEGIWKVEVIMRRWLDRPSLIGTSQVRQCWQQLDLKESYWGQTASAPSLNWTISKVKPDCRLNKAFSLTFRSQSKKEKKKKCFGFFFLFFFYKQSINGFDAHSKHRKVNIMFLFSLNVSDNK